MHRVRRIERLRSGRCLIELENAESFPLYQKELAAFGITEGGILTDSDYAKITEELLPLRAKQRAMYLLQARDRTEHQLRSRLEDGNYPPQIVEEALEYVRGYHYIDDVRYAASYMEYRKDGRSLARLWQELHQRGVSREDFEAAAAQMEEIDERQQIADWAVKKGFCAQTADQKETERFFRFLLRRGYRLSDIQSVLRKQDGRANLSR